MKNLIIKNKNPCFAEKDPTFYHVKIKSRCGIRMYWSFTDKESASQHLKAGAKKVIISAPAKDKLFLLMFEE